MKTLRLLRSGVNKCGGFLSTRDGLRRYASGLFDEIKRRCLVACLLEPLDLTDGFTD